MKNSGQIQLCFCLWFKADNLKFDVPIAGYNNLYTLPPLGSLPTKNQIIIDP